MPYYTPKYTTLQAFYRAFAKYIIPIFAPSVASGMLALSRFSVWKAQTNRRRG
jgi:hypothetical protein